MADTPKDRVQRETRVSYFTDYYGPVDVRVLLILTVRRFFGETRENTNLISPYDI